MVCVCVCVGCIDNGNDNSALTSQTKIHQMTEKAREINKRTHTHTDEKRVRQRADNGHTFFRRVYISLYT